MMINITIPGGVRSFSTGSYSAGNVYEKKTRLNKKMNDINRKQSEGTVGKSFKQLPVIKGNRKDNQELEMRRKEKVKHFIQKKIELRKKCSSLGD